MRNKRIRIVVVLSIVVLSLLSLVGGPSLVLRGLGIVRQGSVQGALAASPSTPDMPPGDPLDTVVIGSPASDRSATYVVEELWAVEVTGRQITEGEAEYRFVFDEAGFNRLFQAYLAPHLQGTPYSNLWFDLRDGGMVVYAMVDMGPYWAFPFPPGVAYQGIAYGYTERGIQIYDVLPFGPADRAGLQIGDVITELGGTPIAGAMHLTEWIQSHNPGDVVTMTVQRGEQVQVVAVELGRWDERERWRYAGLVLTPDVTGARLVPLGLSIRDELYSLPKTGPIANAVADAQRMLDGLFENLIIVGPLEGKARVAQMDFSEDRLTVVMR